MSHQRVSPPLVTRYTWSLELTLLQSGCAKFLRIGIGIERIVNIGTGRRGGVVEVSAR